MKTIYQIALVFLFLAPTFPSVSQITVSPNYYISHSTNEPWGHSSNLDAMTTAFGSGNWARLNFNDPDMATIFTSATHFIFMDGSASTDVNEQITFFINHRTALENWVAAGGRLLLNGGPDLPENLGFGSLSNEYYDNNAGNDARPVTVVGPLLSQPFDLTHQTEYGDSFSHAKVSGDSLRPLILATHSDAVILADKPYGDGFLVFGGMTVSNFHTPQPEGSQLLVNILHHAAISDITPAAPEAGFIVTTPDAVVDNRVTLIDISSGYSADRTWQISPATFEYADGSNEHSSKPVIRFRAAGQYSVMLSVKNGQGQDSETKENYITVQNRRNFYWVGGGGDWESAQHWATSSGGNEFYDEEPTKDDNVFFDENSFSADGQEVFLDKVIFELFNFTVSGTTHAPEFTGEGHFYIYGAITVSSPTIFSVGKLEFKSEEGTVIDLTNVTLGDNTGIEVDGPGTFDFVSPVVSNYFAPYKGNIYTHGHTITVNKFGADEFASAAIWFQNSELHVKQAFSLWPDNDITPSKVDVNLFLGPYSGSYARFSLQDGLELNEVTLAGEIAINNDMPAKKITFLPGTSADLRGNKLTAETFILKGTEDEFITLHDGTFSKTSGTVVAQYVSLANVDAEGGAVFYADKNSEDYGGNTGWIFSTKEVQYITFADISDNVYGITFDLTATSSSGLSIAYAVSSGPATVVGNTVSFTGVGEVTIIASQQGNDTYLPAQEESRSFTVAKGTQDLVFTLADKTFGDAAFDVPVTGGRSSNPVVLSIVSGPASVAGSTVTLTGAGVVTIKASQEGNENYLAAAVEQMFCVNPAKLVVTVTGLNTGAPVLTASAAENYQWLNNGTAIPGATSNTYTITEPGIYSVVTQAEICVSAASDGQVLTITAVEGTVETTLKAHPNPVMNELVVDMTAVNSPDEASVTLYDVSGRLMTTAKGRRTVSIPMQSYLPGQYAVVVSFGMQRITKQIIKK